MEIVTIRQQDQYVLPKVCCACGAPAESGRLLASGSSRSSARFVNLFFPLCDRCAHLSAIVSRRRRIIRWAGLGLSLLASIAGLGISYVLGAIPDISLFTFLGSLTIFVPLALLGTLIAQWLVSVVGLNREVRETFRRVSKAAKVKRYDADVLGGGYITLAFVNEHFADLFQQMNTGVVLPGRLG